MGRPMYSEDAKLFFEPLYFERFYIVIFKPKWRFVNDYPNHLNFPNTHLMIKGAST
jgi:hypothetical protein